jgi:putative endonuclease
VAAQHLESDGFVVLERNWRCELGELPFEAVTRRKLHRIERLGLRRMRERAVRPAAMRVDVVSVLRPASGPTVVEHVRGLR